MTRKQRNTLVRIIISALLTAAGELVPNTMISTALLLGAYLAVG